MSPQVQRVGPGAESGRVVLGRSGLGKLCDHVAYAANAMAKRGLQALLLLLLLLPVTLLLLRRFSHRQIDGRRRKPCPVMQDLNNKPCLQS